MGDSRAQITIKFDIYGEHFDWDASINYYPDDVSGIDRRIAEWFDACYGEARGKFDERVRQSEAARRTKETEREERKELERLKAKYEKPVVK